MARLPRRQTRVLTWPLVTIWDSSRNRNATFFLKPNVTRRAANACGFDFQYQSKPIWETYAHLLELAEALQISEGRLNIDHVPRPEIAQILPHSFG